MSTVRPTADVRLDELERRVRALFVGAALDAGKLEAIEQRITALEAKPARVAAAEAELIEAARQWARVTKLGYIVSRDGDVVARVHLSGRAAADHADHFAREMRAAAERLLYADAG